MFIDNTKYGNPHTSLIKMLKNVFTGNQNVRVSALRPTAQEPHKKHEIVVALEEVGKIVDNGFKVFHFRIEIFSNTTKEEHLTFTYETLDNIDNMIPEGNIVSAETYGTTVHDTIPGERAHLTDINLDVLVIAENFKEV